MFHESLVSLHIRPNLQNYTAQLFCKDRQLLQLSFKSLHCFWRYSAIKDLIFQPSHYSHILFKNIHPLVQRHEGKAGAIPSRAAQMSSQFYCAYSRMKAWTVLCSVVGFIGLSSHSEIGRASCRARG